MFRTIVMIIIVATMIFTVNTAHGAGKQNTIVTVSDFYGSSGWTMIDYVGGIPAKHKTQPVYVECNNVTSLYGDYPLFDIVQFEDNTIISGHVTSDDDITCLLDLDYTTRYTITRYVEYTNDTATLQTDKGMIMVSCADSQEDMYISVGYMYSYGSSVAFYSVEYDSVFFCSYTEVTSVYTVHAPIITR